MHFFIVTCAMVDVLLFVILNSRSESDVGCWRVCVEWGCWGAWDVSGGHCTGICIIMQMKEIELQLLSHIYLVGGSAASAKIWILRMQWKIQLKIKRPCKLISHLFGEYRLAFFGNLYMFMLLKLVDLNSLQFNV